MSDLQPNCCLKIDFQKVDQHAGGKWLIHDTKRRKDNQLQSLKLPLLGVFSWGVNKHGLWRPYLMSAMAHCSRTSCSLRWVPLVPRWRALRVIWQLNNSHVHSIDVDSLWPILKLVMAIYSMSPEGNWKNL